jgi:hypothetical protein
MTDKISYSYSLNDGKSVSAYRLNDGFANVISGLSTQADSNSAGTWYLRQISQQEIENSFRTSWLCRKVHLIPVTDIVRPWRKWLAKPDQITAIEAEERRLGLRQKVRKALLWSRLYGGSAIMLGIAGDDPREPLDVTRIRKNGLQYIHVLNRHELTIAAINMDPGSPQYGEPLEYIVSGGGYQTSVHPSRMVRFTSGDLPDQLAFGNQGWGDPLLQSLRDVLAHADNAQGSFAALPAKARTTTWKVPGLMNMVSTTEGEQKFIRGARVAQQFESLFNVKVISAPSRTGEAGEEWENQTVAFQGIPDMGTWFVQMVAGAADIPMTRMAAMSPGGLNSTGDSDLSNYHANLDAGRELDLRPRLEMIDAALIPSALGAADASIWWEYEPFEVDSETTKATNAGLRATAFKTLSESNAVPSDVLMKMAKAQIIDSGEYPGSEDAYKEYEAQGGDYEPIEAPSAPANDNTVLASATEGLVAKGKSASVAARDARAMLTDAAPQPLYVARMVLNRDELQAWATEQGLGELQPDLHVTIASSRAPVDWMAMENSWADRNNDGSGQLLVSAGGPRLVEPLGDQTAVLMFSNSDLQWRNEEMRRKGCSWDFPDYTPHISLTKADVDLSAVQPYRGRILLGAEIFQTLDDDLGDADDGDA